MKRSNVKIINIGLVLIVSILSFIYFPVPGAVSADESNGKVSIDWSVKMCDSIVSRFTPETFGPWDYNEGLVLEGMWRVYERTGNTRYFNFIKSWVDRFLVTESYIEVVVEIVQGEEGEEEVEKEILVEAGLSPEILLNKLDNMMPGVLLCHLYEATSEEIYKIAARQIRDSIDTYTRTSDGGLVLSITETTKVLALDGTFMLSIFLINYGDVFSDAGYARDECVNQLIIHNNHLKDTATGLAWQAWDELGKASWADPSTNLSPEIWCRGVGWYVVACIEVLEKLPANHPERQNIIDILVDYLDSIKNYQDSITGLWYQVVDKGHLPDNWLEESSACLYTYAMSKAIDAGYISEEDYSAVLKKGFEGALSNIALNNMGKTNLYGTCTGTGPGSPYSYYIDRTQPVNDKHGLGAFLFAFEQQRMKYSDLKHLFQAEDGFKNRAAARTDYKGWIGASYVDFYEETGSFLQVSVVAPATGITTLEIRYSNGDEEDRPMEISVNGNVISSSLSFLPTTAWTVRGLQTTIIPLVLGENVIRFTSITPMGGPNIDWIAFETPVYTNDPPVVTDIIDYTTHIGGSFAEIALDNFVSDVDDTDAEMTWTYTGNTDLIVTIDESRIATISPPDAVWNGSETITFRASDPDAYYDEDSATFTVTRPGQSTVSSMAISPDEVHIGDEVNVSVRIDNTGQNERIYQVLCKVDGVVVEVKEIKLARGTGKHVEFILLMEETGDKLIDINGLTYNLFVQDTERDSGITIEIPIPEMPEETDSASGYWWIIILILAIAALPIIGVVYLIKKKRI